MLVILMIDRNSYIINNSGSTRFSAEWNTDIELFYLYASMANTLNVLSCILRTNKKYTWKGEKSTVDA